VATQSKNPWDATKYRTPGKDVALPWEAGKSWFERNVAGLLGSAVSLSAGTALNFVPGMQGWGTMVGATAGEGVELGVRGMQGAPVGEEQWQQAGVGVGTGAIAGGAQMGGEAIKQSMEAARAAEAAQKARQAALGPEVFNFPTYASNTPIPPGPAPVSTPSAPPVPTPAPGAPVQGQAAGQTKSPVKLGSDLYGKSAPGSVSKDTTVRDVLGAPAPGNVNKGMSVGDALGASAAPALGAASKLSAPDTYGLGGTPQQKDTPLSEFVPWQSYPSQEPPVKHYRDYAERLHRDPLYAGRTEEVIPKKLARSYAMDFIREGYGRGQGQQAADFLFGGDGNPAFMVYSPETIPEAYAKEFFPEIDFTKYGELPAPTYSSQTTEEIQDEMSRFPLPTSERDYQNLTEEQLKYWYGNGRY